MAKLPSNDDNINNDLIYGTGEFMYVYCHKSVLLLEIAIQQAFPVTILSTQHLTMHGLDSFYFGGCFFFFLHSDDDGGDDDEDDVWRRSDASMYYATYALTTLLFECAVID